MSLEERIDWLQGKIEKLEEKYSITDEQKQVLNKAQFSLQCYDKGQLLKEELEVIMGICFKTGIPTKDWDELCLNQVLMQLSDKQLVTEDVVRKCLFSLSPKTAEQKE